MHEPLSEAWRSAKDALVDATGAALAASVNPPERPRELFHFTDLVGMTGILESRTLWATLATSLNDQSEISYALERTRRLIHHAEVPGSGTFLENVQRFLDPENSPPNFRLRWQTFVISFCAR